MEKLVSPFVWALVTSKNLAPFEILNMPLGVDWIQGYHHISIPAHHSYEFGLLRTVSCIQHESIRINDTVKQISHRGRSQILSKVSVETWIGIYMYTPIGSKWTMPITWPVIGQTPHLRNWVIRKGVQMRVRWRSVDQTVKWGHVCTSLVYCL